MRLQTEIPNQIYKDLRDYCKKNDLKLNELIRFLIRAEIYWEQTFSKTYKEDQKKAIKESLEQIELVKGTETYANTLKLVNKMAKEENETEIK